MLFRSLCAIRPSLKLQPAPALKVAATALGLGFATWFSTNKYILDQEFVTLETHDDLKEGEVRQLLVGPKP